MADKFLLTIMPDTDDDSGKENAATEVISEDDAKGILADFGAIRYLSGTLIPSPSDWFLMKKRMMDGVEATFFYNDCVDDTPWVGKIINV